MVQITSGIREEDMLLFVIPDKKLLHLSTWSCPAITDTLCDVGGVIYILRRSGVASAVDVGA